VLLSSDHRLADRKSVDLADLCRDPMVMLDVPPSERYFSDILDGLGLQPNIEHRPAAWKRSARSSPETTVGRC
jgi:hypothetical protein